MGATVSAGEIIYVVKKGDVLSEVALKHMPGPIWGERGGIQKIIASNPNIKNPDFILPGEKIKIARDEAVLVDTPLAEDSRLPAEVAPKQTEAEPPAQVLTANESVITPEEKTPLFRRGALVSLSPFYALSGVSAKDTAGTPLTIASQYNAGFDLGYIQEWTQSTRSFVKLRLGQISFEPPTDGSISIVDRKKFISGIGLGLGVDLTSRFNIEFIADYKKELFARGVSTQIVTLDTVAVPALGTKLSFELIELDPFVLGMSTLLSAQFPTKTDSYRVGLGATYGASLYLKQFTSARGTSNFQTELGFTTRSQDTSLTKQSQVDLTLGLRIFFPVGRRENDGEEGGR